MIWRSGQRQKSSQVLSMNGVISRELGFRKADYAKHVLLKMTTMTTYSNFARNIHICKLCVAQNGGCMEALVASPDLIIGCTRRLR